MFSASPVSPRISRIKEKRREHDDGHVMLCAERTKIYTDYCKTHEAQHPLLLRAGALYEWCAKKVVRIEEDEMFVGNLGTDWRSTHPYVEWGIGWLKEALALPEDEFIREWQTPGVFAYISPENKEIFEEAVQYWEDRTIRGPRAGHPSGRAVGSARDNCTSFGNRGKTGVLRHLPGTLLHELQEGHRQGAGATYATRPSPTWTTYAAGSSTTTPKAHVLARYQKGRRRRRSS